MKVVLAIACPQMTIKVDDSQRLQRLMVGRKGTRTVVSRMRQMACSSIPRMLSWDQGGDFCGPGEYLGC